MSDDELARADVAHLNLLCATGLPGSESLDIGGCLAKLDEWAQRVRWETERHLYKFQQSPEDYQNSEGYFRMLMLVTVLQQDLAVHYNMERVREVDFRRSEDLFIHGMIDATNGGTCVSMPVLYTSVARRLHYPVKIALAKGHVFCRWDSSDDRINIEGAGVGMNSYPDEYYLKWPHPITDGEVERGDYLRSLTSREELAVFMAARGHCLLDIGRAAEAVVAHAHAHELAPRLPQNRAFLVDAVRRMSPSLLAAKEDCESTIAEIDRLNRMNCQRDEQRLQQIMNLNRQDQTSKLGHPFTNPDPVSPTNGFLSPIPAQQSPLPY